ncbi:hypothetical protein B0H16DRAFT_1849692, partial [Mycena metata]
ALDSRQVKRAYRGVGASTSKTTSCLARGTLASFARHCAAAARIHSYSLPPSLYLGSPRGVHACAALTGLGAACTSTASAYVTYFWRRSSLLIPFRAPYPSSWLACGALFVARAPHSFSRGLGERLPIPRSPSPSPPLLFCFLRIVGLSRKTRTSANARRSGAASTAAGRRRAAGACSLFAFSVLCLFWVAYAFARPEYHPGSAAAPLGRCVPPPASPAAFLNHPPFGCTRGLVVHRRLRLHRRLVQLHAVHQRSTVLHPTHPSSLPSLRLARAMCMCRGTACMSFAALASIGSRHRATQLGYDCSQVPPVCAVAGI